MKDFNSVQINLFPFLRQVVRKLMDEVLLPSYNATRRFTRRYQRRVVLCERTSEMNNIFSCMVCHVTTDTSLDVTDVKFEGNVKFLSQNCRSNLNVLDTEWFVRHQTEPLVVHLFIFVFVNRVFSFAFTFYHPRIRKAAIRKCEFICNKLVDMQIFA